MSELPKARFLSPAVLVLLRQNWIILATLVVVTAAGVMAGLGFYLNEQVESEAYARALETGLEREALAYSRTATLLTNSLTPEEVQALKQRLLSTASQSRLGNAQSLPAQSSSRELIGFQIWLRDSGVPAATESSKATTLAAASPARSLLRKSTLC